MRLLLLLMLGTALAAPPDGEGSTDAPEDPPAEAGGDTEAVEGSATEEAGGESAPEADEAKETAQSGDLVTAAQHYNQAADRSGWLEAYPHAYGRDAEPAMEEHGLNPYLLWSLMIVESDLNPDSVSHADAYGLLQVIPKTGELIAGGFGQPDFGVHDVIEIEHAFQYGTWYLGRGGWCPGLDVPPFRGDVSADLDFDGPNTISYRASLYGQEPANAGNIWMSSYLVFYR